LCKAIYIRPEKLGETVNQPYKAFVWFLQNYAGQGFLGNPRVSFIHQATRICSGLTLKRHRAWAMWYLSCAVMPQLPPDPTVQESPPSQDVLQDFLNKNGLPGEGTDWMEAMQQAQTGSLRKPAQAR
jgi:hypothetical protein